MTDWTSTEIDFEICGVDSDRTEDAEARIARELAGIGYWEFTLSPLRAWWSAPLRAILGTTVECDPRDLSDFLERVHPADRSRVASFADGTQADVSGLLDYRLLTGDGRWLWVSGRIRAFGRDEQNRARRIVGSVEDISVRKDAEVLLLAQRTLSLGLLQVRDPEALSTAILESALCLPEIDAGAFYWLDADGTLCLAAHHGLSEAFLEEHRTLDPAELGAAEDGGPAGQCSCSRFNDACTNRSVALDPAYQREGVHAVLEWPLEAGGRIVAALRLASRHSLHLSQRTRDNLALLDKQYVAAVEAVLDQLELRRHESFLREVLDATTDGLLVVDAKGSVAAANQRFQDLWRIPDELMASGDDARLLAFVLDQLAEPKAFLDEVQRLYASAEESSDQLRFKDGRVFERRSNPLRVHGKQGRVWSFRDITTLEKVRREIDAERGHLRALVETLPDLVWLKDPDGIYLGCNPVFERLFGTRQAAIVGKTDYDFVDSELADFFRANDRRAMAADRPSTNEEWLTFADGGYRGLFETIKTPMRAADGTLIGVLGIARDITTQRQATEALREREELFRAIVSQAADGIDLVDAETLRIVEANDAACRMLGYARAELLGLSLTAFQADFDEAALRARVERVIRLGNASFETRHRSKDGRILDVQVSVRALRLHGRDHLVGVWRDVTGEKAAKIARHNDAERWRVLIQNSRDGIAIFGQDHRIIEANPRFAQMLGYSMEELLRLHAWDWDLVMSEAEIRAGFANMPDLNTTFDTRHGRKDGTVYDAEISVSGARFGDEGVVITVVRDVTERKQAQRVLQEREAMLRAIFGQVSVGIDVVDVETQRFLQFNQASHTLLGYDPEEFGRLRLPDIQAVPPEHFEHLFRDSLADLRAAGSLSFESQHRQRGGAPIDVQIALRLIEIGGRECILSVWSNISEQKRAREALQTREEIFRSIVSQAADGMVLIDPRTLRFVEFNDAACTTLGYGRDEFAELSLVDLQTVLQPAEVRAEVDRIIARGSGDFEIRHRCKDGSERDVWVSNRPLLLRGVTYIAAVWRDITGRNAAEAAARRERQVRETFVESIPGLFYALDTTGRFLFWNKRMEDATERNVEELSVLTALDLFEGTDRDHISERIRQAFQVGESNAEGDIVGKNGRRTRYLFTGLRIDLDGQPVLVGTGMDVTAFKRAEAALRDSEERLRLALKATNQGLYDLNVRTGETQVSDE